MAIEVYPPDIPTHDENQDNSVEPTTAVQDSGYPTSAEPPSSEHNYLFNRLLRAALSMRQKPIKDWTTATLFEEFELVLDPTTRILYQANTQHTSTGSTLTENDSASWDVISENLNELLGPLVDGDMAVGDTATGNFKKSTVTTEVGPLLTEDPGIINGNMGNWQANQTVISAPSSTFVADLFLYTTAGPQVHDLTQDGDVPLVIDGAIIGSLFSILAEVTTANTGLDITETTVISYHMEGFQFAKYFGKTFTMTFFVKSDVTGIYTVGFKNQLADRSFVAEYTIDVADTWEKKTITVTHDITGLWNLTNGAGIRIVWALAGGANFQTSPDTWANGNFHSTSSAVNFDDTVGNKVRLQQVSFNLGSVARNNIKDETDEITRITRYFKKYFSVKVGAFKTTSGARFIFPLAFERIMISNPTVTIDEIATTGGGAATQEDINVTNVNIVLTSTTAVDENMDKTLNVTLDSRIL